MQQAGYNNQRPGFVDPIAKQKEFLEQKRDLAIELARKKAEEEAAAAAAAAAAELASQQTGQGDQRLGEGSGFVGGHQKHHRVGKTNNTHHIVEAKKATSGALVPQTDHFVVYGRATELEANDPLKEGSWTEPDYAKSRDQRPASPWRSMHDANGVMKHFFVKQTPKIQSALEQATVPVSSGISRIITKGSLIQTATNDSPFFVGLFAIGAKVSRSPEGTLFGGRINQIQESFIRAYESNNDGESIPSISLVKILPPNTHTAIQDDKYYKSSDWMSSDLSTGAENRSKAWINLDKHDFRKSIINNFSNSHQLSNNLEHPDRLAYVKDKSVLLEFISWNWRDILEKLGVPQNQPMYFEEWKLNANMAYPDAVVNAMTDEELIEEVRVRPIMWKIVEKALEMAEEVIDKLPFERPENHQWYIARLCGDSWCSKQGPAMDNIKRLCAPDGPCFSVHIETTSWFEIVTNAQ
jgi:hypothetical protein